MPFLYFPSPDVLRLALASGVVPDAVTCRPARVAWTEQGGLWLEPEQTDRELPNALARLGVTGTRLEPAAAWSELPFWTLAVPLRPVPLSDSEETILFDVPGSLASAFLTRLGRSGSSRIAVAYPSHEDRCWITQPRTACDAASFEDSFRCYREQAPGVWVPLGHEHPLVDRLPVPVGQTLLLRSPREWQLLDARPPVHEPTEFVLSSPPLRSSRVARLPRVALRFRLVEGPASNEALWIAPANDPLLDRIDPRLHSHLEAAEVTLGSERRLLLRPRAGSRSRSAFPTFARGYSAHPQVPNLFLPGGRRIQPSLRDRVLAQVFGCGPGRLVWLEEDAGGSVAVHSMPTAAFQPLEERVKHRVLGSCHLKPVGGSVDPFELPAFQVADAVVPAEPVPEFEEPPPIPKRTRPTPELAPVRGGFLHSLRDLVGRLLGLSQATAAGNEAAENAPTEAESVRIGQKLASKDSLVHGTDWPAHRRRLETQLVDELPACGPAERADHWAELATVYGVVGNPADSALCWINAIWDSTDPPRSWQKQWLLAESRLARMTLPTVDPDGLTAETLAKPEAARILASYWATDTEAMRVESLACLEQHCDDLPIRLTWLALRRLCGDDPLGMARWRDRLLTRLRDSGPGLDLDEPSFLRFHGTISAERFQQAREWLSRAREPIRGWFKRTVRGGRLRNVGLEAESACTAAYLDLLIAWGLGCVGERTKSRSGADRGRGVLERHETPVHGLLLRMFQHRIREAQDGHPAKEHWPAPIRNDLESLGEYDRYCIDRLREHLGILEPGRAVNAYRGRDRREVLGTDLLAERLNVLLNRSDPVLIHEEARQLLEVCTASPSSENVPRVVLALLEHAPRLEGAVANETLSLAIPAMEWLETWMQSRGAIVPSLGRLIDCALKAAVGQSDAGRSIADYLCRRLQSSDRAIRAALRRKAASVFRSLHSLRLEGQAERILQHLESEPEREGPLRLGLAVGWFTLGRDEGGTRILDEARERLFLTGRDDLRERTVLALAYADALGAAPPRIAMGRLEEIFQRLGPVAVVGSTNAFFTLQPLRLVDTVVRAVVGEGFSFGPRVQSWLEDDEFLIRQRIQTDMTRCLRDHGLQ